MSSPFRLSRRACRIPFCLAFAALVSGLIPGCDTPLPVDFSPSVDLVAELPWATVLREPSDLGIGTDRGRRYLGEGWWRNEGRVEDPFVWAVGSASDLSLPVVEPRDLVLMLDLRPFTYPSSPPQEVSVELDGRGVFDFELEPGVRATVAVPLPGELLRAGANALRLGWGWSREPRQVSESRDARNLAAALHGARLCDPSLGPCAAEAGPSAPSEETAEPHDPRAEGDRLWLPWSSRVDFFVDLPANSRWAADAGIRGAGSLRVEVLRQRESGAEAPRPETVGRLDAETVRSADAGGQERVFELGSEPGPARLRLTALGVGRGGIRLERPRIEAPVPDVPAEIPGEAPAVESSAVELPAAESPMQPTGLVVYSIDTLRADRLGYRGGSVATPVLDALADRSLVFENLVAQSPWTKASMASIFTGLWPPAHGAFNRSHRLENGLVTLAEILHAAGWSTAAIVTNPNITETFGFHQGFEHFEYLGEKVPAQEAHRAVERLLEQRTDDGRPLFLWIHTLDPHSPYDPPDDFRRQHLPEVPGELARASLDVINELRSGRRPMDDGLMDRLEALYDTEIAYADRSLGECLDLLEAHGLGDALLTVISDHGEEFLEHGNLEHGRALHVESLDVPWIMSGPGLAPERISEPAQHTDVLPTLLARLGLAVPQGLEGHAWLTADGSVRRPDGPRSIYSHLHLDGDERLSVVDDGFKLISVVRSAELVWPRLYDLRRDPGETVDVLEEHPVRAGRLLRLLRRRLAEADGVEGVEVEFDEETRRSLEALGYL